MKKATSRADVKKTMSVSKPTSERSATGKRETHKKRAILCGLAFLHCCFVAPIF
ncbi:MAG: hypothetical protein AB8B62_06710 [Roseobacter sp.]